MKTYILILIPFLLTFSLSAQEGGLDLSFNGNGKLLMEINYTDDAKAVILQPDGKIVMGGSTERSSQDMLIVRLTANGSPDVSFGNQGLISVDIDGGDDAVFGMALQPDGKILAVGAAKKNGQPGIALIRLNANGSLDKSFGNDGYVTWHVGTGNNYFNDVIVFPDGKIVVCGYGYFSSNGMTGVLMGFNSNGSPNRDFGDTGVVYQVVNNGGTYFHKMLLLPGNKFLVCGQGYQNHTVFLAVKYNSDGTLDEDFAGNGITVASFDNPASAEAIAVQKDGKIVLAGNTIVDGYYRFAAVRLMPDGQLDQSFGANGKVYTKIYENASYANAVAILGDGKIILAGNAQGYWNTDYALVRYYADGTLDKSFNYDGIMTKNIGGDDDFVGDAILQQDGRLVTVGFSRKINSNGYEVSAARFLAGPSTVGYEEHQELRMQLYPNPASDFLHLNFEAGSHPSVLEIIDAKGAIAIQENLNGPSADIDVSALPRGIYSIRIMTEKDVLVRKVIIE